MQRAKKPWTETGNPTMATQKAVNGVLGTSSERMSAATPSMTVIGYSDSWYAIWRSTNRPHGTNCQRAEIPG